MEDSGNIMVYFEIEIVEEDTPLFDRFLFVLFEIFFGYIVFFFSRICFEEFKNWGLSIQNRFIFDTISKTIVLLFSFI